MVLPTPLLLTLILAQTATPKLGVGDPAPPLVYGKWLKGTPVNSLEKGKTYVVEFWATWCGPCIRTMPHLSALRKKYEGQVDFISMNVWEADWAAVPNFVASQGDRMDYPIAQDLLDKTPALAATDAEKARWALDHGKASASWLKASGYEQVGIPCGFIVNKEGRIAWIGDPAGIDVPLEAVVSGTWDMKQAAADNKDFLDTSARREQVMKNVQALREKKDFGGAAKAIGDFVAEQPAKRADLLADKFAIEFTDMKDAAAATATAELALQTTRLSYISPLSEIAFEIAYPEPGNPKIDGKLSMRIAMKADEYDRGQRVAVKRALAKLSAGTADLREAVRYSNEALELAKVISKGSVPAIQKELESYGGAKAGG